MVWIIQLSLSGICAYPATISGTGNMDYEMFLVRLSRLKTNPYVLVEFLTENDEYAQAQRLIRAIAGKVGVKILGTQPEVSHG